jgi:ubiquinone/menaquinone biosynthesis C-methylase UbiE
MLYIIKNLFQKKNKPVVPLAENPAPIEILETDAYDRAYYWAWQQPSMKTLVRLCYKTPDFADNARRFSESEEFVHTVDLIRKYASFSSDKPKVLDFGCGNGIASYALAKRGFDVIGLDSSNGLLAGLGAARKLIGLDGTQMTFQFHNGERVLFTDNSIDVIYLREVLHHIKDLPGFLKTLYSILKPGGLVICIRDVVIWNECQRQDFFAKHPLYPITQDEGCYYLNEYVESFEDSGYELLKVLAPSESAINSYPQPFTQPVPFDYEYAKTRQEGYDLFTFLAQKKA